VKVGYFSFVNQPLSHNSKQAPPAVVQISFPADLFMLAITLTAPPHCSQVSISITKTRLSLCAQVIDWCSCTSVLSCPVGNACLALFRSVIDTRCGLFVKTRHINSGFGHPNLG